MGDEIIQTVIIAMTSNPIAMSRHREAGLTILNYSAWL